jgi:hypothetical protein
MRGPTPAQVIVSDRKRAILEQYTRASTSPQNSKVRPDQQSATLPAGLVSPPKQGGAAPTNNA